jgi:hypothetical protein
LRYKEGVRAFATGIAAISALLAAAAGAGAAAPTYRIDFAGSGTEHQTDVVRYVADDNSCFEREQLDETATLTWTSSWSRFSTVGGATGAAPAQAEGSRIRGTHVKDSCDAPPEAAAPGWIGTTSCDDPLSVVTPASVTVASRSKTALLLQVRAPELVVPVSSECSLTLRQDQLVAHVSVPLKKLNALARGRSLVLTVGTARPGARDLYTPSLNCSRPTKPYEGYRTTDACADELSWSATVRITRA